LESVRTEEEDGEAGDEIDGDEKGTLFKAVGDAMLLEVLGPLERHAAQRIGIAETA